jgi:uncharacterized oligopeptide transporter (OPT) family protein
MMSLQSALLGFAIFKLRPLLPRLFSRISSTPLTPQENVVLQTTAVATGTMPLAAGLVGIIPALGMMNREQDGRDPIELSYVHLVLWCFAVAFFGVFLAVPLRRQVIVKEKLVFPSGTATAQLIALLHRAPPPGALNPTPGGAYRRVPRGDDEHDEGGKDDPISGKGWAALGWSFLASGSMTVSFVQRAQAHTRSSRSSFPSYSRCPCLTFCPFHLRHLLRLSGSGFSPLHCLISARASSWACP